MAESKKKKEIQADTEAAAEVSELLTDTSSENVNAESIPDVKQPAKITKAGKKSQKALDKAEAEETRKAAVAERKEAEAAPKPKMPVKPHVRKRGKKYQELAKLVDRNRQYDLAEALELAKTTSPTKFDASIELHANLGVDPRQADQMVRSSVVLPNGTGKSLRVAVLASGDKAAAAKKAGADVTGEDDLITSIEKGKINFDMLVTTPDQMPKLARLAKILGPKGLMPNPKSGTVTTDVAKAVAEAKTGKVEFRIDKQAIIHQPIGKVSFDKAKLEANAVALLLAILKAKPAGAKGTYVKAITMSTSMGPGIKMNVQQTIADVNAKK